MGTANHTTVKRARDLKAEGISRADIGNIIGVSRASVYRYLGISTDERPA